MIFEHESVAAALSAILVARRARGRSGSLRALARRLEVSPSLLSSIAAGKRALTPARARQLAEVLKLPVAEAQYFELLARIEGVEAANPGSPAADLRRAARELRQEAMTRTECDDADAFALLADWRHVAILEMTYLQEFTVEIDTVAERLGIARADAETAIDRLLRAGLLKRDEQGALVKTDKNLYFKAAQRAAALNAYYDSLLSLGRVALERLPFERRIFGSQTVAIDAALMPELRTMMRGFLHQVGALVDRSTARDCVVQIAVQMYDLLDPGMRAAEINSSITHSPVSPPTTH